jgi:hypothetical protein
VKYAKKSGWFWLLTPTLLLFAAAVPTGAQAACQHGASIFNTCDSVRRSCAAAADCVDTNECTDDACDTQSLSNVTDCIITLSHADTCGDRTKVNEGFDVEDVGGDNVRVPPVAGSLPINSVNGNAVCCAGPVLPCFVAPAGDAGVIPNSASGCGNLPLPGVATPGSVDFRQNTYVVQPNDPDPLPDQGTVKVQDQCNASATGCSGLQNSIQFTASTDLETGCVHNSTPDSTPCTDNDGNLCTTAGCNGQSACDQNHILKPCTNDDCNSGQCDGPTGNCIPRPDSTPCTDTDGNACTQAGCEANGAEVSQCVQTHVLTPDSTPCTDNDGNLCTTAGCNGQGACDQNHILKPCTNDDCNSGQCDGPTGNCIPRPDSTPCTDTDGKTCTISGCNGQGTCDQIHIDQCGCGDGTLDPGETCDPPDPAINPVTNQPFCRDDCTFCGDAQPNGPETCDDGNTVSGCDPNLPIRPLDDCQNNCTPPICEDPAKIKYSSSNDSLSSHGRIKPVAPATSIDPTVVLGGCEVTLTRDDGTLIYSSDRFSITGGRPGRYKYKNSAAKQTKGVAALSMQRRCASPCEGPNNYYRYTLRAYGKMAGMDNAPACVGNSKGRHVTTHVFIGKQEWTVSGCWIPVGTPTKGWRLDAKGTFQ